MNYELVKQLKDGGFPGYAHAEDGADGITVEVQGNQVRVYEPTLSELIAACGDEQHGDWFFLQNHGELIWEAGFQAIYNDSQRDVGLVAIGDTPEEAVAELWLALNSKQ